MEIYVAHLPPIRRGHSKHEQEDTIDQRSFLHDLSQQPGLQSEIKSIMINFLYQVRANSSGTTKFWRLGILFGSI